MPFSESSRKDGALLVLWPIAFGLVLTLLRVIVLTVFGLQRPNGVRGLLLGLLGQIAFALLLALPLHFLRRSAARWLVHGATVVVVLLNAVAFHYEAVFGRLPGASVLYYLNEARHVSASASAHAPLFALVLEAIGAGALLVVAAEWLAKRTPRPRPFAAAAIVLVSAIVTTAAFAAFPALIPRNALWASRVPIFWAIQTWSFGRLQGGAAGPIGEQQILEFQTEIGHRVPFGAVDARYPLCGAAPRDPARKGNGRSVIFLVLESVGLEELRLVHDGQAVMPNLRRIAGESVFLPRVKASGTKSLQAMPALFAGIPPQAAEHLLWRKPLPNVEGFPLILRQRGYRTAYFHGGDLSFEQQRPFLRMAGFEDVHEYALFEGHPFLAWGHSDDVMFGKLRSWIETHRTAHDARPYLATLFTLSTHDPFVLPPERPRVFSGEGTFTSFVEALRFLDEQLGAFYQWYVTHEAQRGTLLIITADHAPHLLGDRRLQDGEVARFDVPLLIHGVPAQELARVTQPERRPAAQHDLPATILARLDVSPGPCDQGLDLLASDSQWNDERVLYSVAGDQLESFHVWFREAHVQLDLISRSAAIEPSARGALDPKASATYERRARAFHSLARDLSAHLMATNGFAPPPSTARLARPALPRVERPIFIAHRGQSRGPQTTEHWNMRGTIEQALADGFEWVEVDVNLTRDDVPVLIHDASADTPVGERAVRSLTLAELRALPGLSGLLTLEQALALFGNRANLLVEVKPQSPSLYDTTILTLKSAALVRSRRSAGTVIMDSFSSFVAASLKQHCGCAVGIDAPPRQLDSAWVDDAAITGMDWIYVDHRQASPELIRYAHGRGLRVLVFTVNEVREIAHLAPEWPDAIITDRAALAAEIDRRPVAAPPQ
ncbi:MAG: sulfatase-like hydrolase/transferase [Thermoanaerobaculia bacterium]